MMKTKKSVVILHYRRTFLKQWGDKTPLGLYRTIGSHIMKNYTDDEKEEIGQEIALLLGMRKSKTDKGRFITSWGNKTGKER
jgi:hypothetical protein